MQYYLRGEIIMKCQFCNVEMVYKPIGDCETRCARSRS